jgi:hypothetical protein
MTCVLVLMGIAMPSETLTQQLTAAVADKPALLRILQTSRVHIALDALEGKGREATQQQAAFRREVTIANVCLMIAGVLSGLVLLVAPHIASKAHGTQLISWLPVAIGVLTLALGAAAAFFAHKVREAGRLQRWLTTRSGAEAARLAIFTTIAEKVVSESPQEALSALDLVNRVLLEDQRVWYRGRAAEHRKSSEKTAFWGGAGTALAFAGGSGAVIASFEPNQAWIAIFGVIGAALAAYAVSRERLRMDSTSAALYEKAADALDEIAARYDMVQAEVGNGQTAALTAFTTAITDQLSQEHRRWLEGSAQAEAVLRELDQQLERMAAREGPKPVELHAGDTGRTAIS